MGLDAEVEVDDAFDGEARRDGAGGGGLVGGARRCSRSRICCVEAALAQVVLGDALGNGRVKLVQLLQKLLHLLVFAKVWSGKGGIVQA